LREGLQQISLNVLEKETGFEQAHNSSRTARATCSAANAAGSRKTVAAVS